MQIKISRGADIRFRGPPSRIIAKGNPIGSVALLGEDHPGLRPALAVKTGDRVAAGDPLFADRARPQIVFTAPAGGTVAQISYGPRRSLDALVIAVDGEESRIFEPPAVLDRASVAGLLLASGAWPSFRARPFGRIPDPSAVPDALFVTAIDTAPLAGDPAVVIEAHERWFARGLEALRHLTEGPVYLCHAPGAPVAAVEGVRAVAFSGPHPAGLPGTHIHHLHPVGARGSVWHVGYQDVIAIGCLFETGRIWTERVFALAGPCASEPGLVRARPGAALRDLARGRLLDPAARLLSGSPLDGRAGPYLGRYHLQVCTMPHSARKERDRSLPARLRAFATRRPAALVPNAAHERAAPAGILPVPFLRAIGIGDSETARRLGALELVEEDMALLAHVDRADYGALLRATLDEIEAAQ